VAGFLYFIEGLSEKPSAEKLAELALGHLEPVQLSLAPVAKGPNGKSGLVVAVEVTELNELAEGSFPVGFYPEKQSWQASGKIYLGIQTGTPPRECDLRRKNYQGGYKIDLAGESYLAPSLRMLPRIWVMDPVSGEMKKKAKAQFAGLEAIAERIWKEFLNENKIEQDETEKAEPLTDIEKYKAARDFLAVNYCLGDHEINYMQLFDDNSVEEILGAVVDMQGFIAMAKAAEAETEAENKKKGESSPSG
jgi:hypothetical protein